MNEKDPSVQLILEVISSIAPEAELDGYDNDVDFVDDLDLDSMDQLNIAVGVFERTGVEIPERDQAGLRTVEAFAAYLRATPSPRE